MQQCTGLHSCKVRKLFTKSSQSYTAPYVFFMHRLSANFFIMESVGSTYSNSTNTQLTNMKNEIIYMRQNQRLETSCHSFGCRNKYVTIMQYVCTFFEKLLLSTHLPMFCTIFDIPDWCAIYFVMQVLLQKANSKEVSRQEPNKPFLFANLAVDLQQFSFSFIFYSFFTNVVFSTLLHYFFKNKHFLQRYSFFLILNKLYHILPQKK